MNPQLPALREINLERRQAALEQQGRSRRSFESWAEPPYEILCPLEWHEVSDPSRWDHVFPASRMERGLYLCQPLVGIYQQVGTRQTPCWLLVLRILLGSETGRHMFRTFWLSERALERSAADLRRLKLPPSIARQTVAFDRGGVLAVVDWNAAEGVRLPYSVYSMTSLEGISTLHAEFLEYQRATSEQGGLRREPGLLQ
jgi:hypothetical protein